MIVDKEKTKINNKIIIPFRVQYKNIRLYLHPKGYNVILTFNRLKSFINANRAGGKNHFK